MQEEVVCPSCHSNQIAVTQKGFNSTASLLNGLAGGSTISSIGVGMIGSNKVVITCLKCGNQFKAGEGALMTIDKDGTMVFENQVKEEPPMTKAAMKKTFIFILYFLLLLAGFIAYKTYF